MIIFAMFNSACGNRSNQNPNIDISGNIYKNSTSSPKEIKVNMEKMAMSFTANKIVVLDTSAVVGDIDKVQVVGDNIYILDKRKAKALFCFSKSGKLKWTFANNPYQKKFFVRLGDFHVRNESVYLLDDQGGRVLELDAAGKFLNEKNFSHIKHLYPENIFRDENGNFVLFNADMGDYERFQYELVVLNPECKKILSYHFPKTHDPSIKRWKSEVSPLQINTSNTGFYYTRILNDTIYNYKNGVFAKSYVMDFGKNKIPDRIRKKEKYTIDEFLLTKYMGNIERVHETDSVVSFTFYNGNTLSYHQYNKNSKVNKTVPMAFFRIDSYLQTMLPVGSGTDEYICKLEPSNILRFWGNYKTVNSKLNDADLMRKLEKEMPKLSKLKKQISSSSNPILAFVN